MCLSNRFKITAVIVTVGILAIIASTVLCIQQITKEEFLSRHSASNTSRAINITLNYVTDIERNLTKAQLGNKGAHIEENIHFFAEAWKKAGQAREAISAIPSASKNVGELMAQLNLIGDFAYDMMVKTAADYEFSVEDWKRSEELRQVCKKIAAFLEDTSIEKESGRLLQEQASLPAITDDKKSDKIFRRNTAKIEIPVEEGVEIAKFFLDRQDITDIVYRGTTDREIQADLPVYSYEIYVVGNDTPTIWMDISREGGYPVMMLSTEDSIGDGTSIDLTEAVDVGQQHLKYLGFSNMEEYEYSTNGESYIISYAPVVDGVIIYTDNVKLKINMNNGTITGFQAVNFFTSNGYDSFHKPLLTQDEALELVSDQFRVENIRLAVTDKEGITGEDVYCYAIEGYYGGEGYVIFINADNGEMVNIANKWDSKGQ